MNLNLKGKRVVVTGSSRGIGFAIARCFLEEGAQVAIHGVNPERLAHAETQLLPYRAQLHAVASDIATADGVTDLFGAVDSFWDGLDILINNAAIYPPSDFAQIDLEGWDRVMNTNVRAVYLCAQQAYTRMAAGQGGVIINASSLAARIPAYPRGLYSMSKAAVSSLTQVLAAEYAPANIRVNAYMPGLIAAESEPEARPDDAVLAQIALGRPGRADEVAAPVVFLASSKASYISGAILEISGGKLAVQSPRAIWDHAAANQSSE